MKHIMILLLLALPVLGNDKFCQLGPYVGSNNFTADLVGTEDSREGTWGTTEAHTWVQQFYPPAGFTTRILSIKSIVDATMVVSGTPIYVYPGTSVGVLGAIANLPPGLGGSSHADFLSNSTFVYGQGVVSSSLIGISFDMSTPIGFSEVTNNFLGADESLYYTVAKYLDNTFTTTHIEITTTILYTFVRKECL